MTAAKQRRHRGVTGASRSSKAAAGPAPGLVEIESQIDKALTQAEHLMAAFHEARKGGLVQLGGSVQQDDIERLGETLKALASARQAMVAAHQAPPTPRQIGSSFLTGLQEENQTYISPKRFSAVMGVQVNVLADLAGVHRNTLRNVSSERAQSKLREMARVISAAERLTGDLTAALYWYRNEPIGEYGHRTPAELVAAGHVDAVLAYLRDLENGATG